MTGRRFFIGLRIVSVRLGLLPGQVAVSSNAILRTRLWTRWAIISRTLARRRPIAGTSSAATSSRLPPAAFIARGAPRRQQLVVGPQVVIHVRRDIEIDFFL
jgi:hypothetical protein